MALSTTKPDAPKRGVAGRFGASVIDQALASVSNLAMSVVIASQVSLSEFGAFGLVFATYLLVQGAARAAIGEALLVKQSESLAADARAVLAAGTLIGLVGSFGSGLVCALLSGSLQSAFGALTIVLVFGVTQDCMRYVAFAELRPAKAMIADCIWCVVQFSGYTVVVLMDKANLVTLILIWGLGAAVSLLYQLSLYRVLPSYAAASRWLRDRRDLSPRFFCEYLTMSGVQQGSIFILGIAAGLDQVGGYRAAQVILGPANVIALGAAVVVLPMAAARAREARTEVVRFSATVSVALCLVTLSYIALSLVVPDWLGRFALGESWALGSSLLVLVGATIAVNNLSYGATSMIRGMHQARASLVMRVAFAPFTITAATLGAVYGGARGMAGVLVFTSMVQCVGWWFLLNRLLSIRDRDSRYTAAEDSSSCAEGAANG